MWILQQQPTSTTPPRRKLLFLEDIHDALLPLVQEGKIDAFDIGKTVENRPIWAFEVHKKRIPIKKILFSPHYMQWNGYRLNRRWDYFLDFLNIL